MNAQELYEELKRVADYFGVGFHGFDQISVEVKENQIVFSDGSMTVTLNLKT